MKWTLKSIRVNLGYTQEEIAELLGITPETWRKYETYKAYPDIKKVKKIIEISNINFDDIIFLQEEFAKSE